RSSFQVTDSTKERYCQCQNINCGSTFVTHETVVRFIVTPALVNNAHPHPTVSGQGHMNF
ncbi:levansucrase regulator, partial [Salmonella enterica]|nr:levansucrase regulator [Salmonella enterica]